MKKIFAIYDSKGQFYDHLFSAASDADAVRLFDNLVFSNGSPYHAYSEDFSLYCLGDFDPAVGSISCVQPAPLTSALERQCYFEALRIRREREVQRITESGQRDQKEND